MPSPYGHSLFSTRYAGLLAQGNWILVEPRRPGRTPLEIPERITVRKSDGSILIDAAGTPVEIPYCALSELVALNIVALAEKESNRRHIYRATGA